MTKRAKQLAPRSAETGGAASDEERLNQISYRVAEMWVQHRRPSVIAQELSLGQGPAGHAAVKRHIERARRKGYLMLAPPTSLRSSEELAARFPSTVFHVVDDELLNERSIFRKAARVLAGEINELLRRADKPQVIVGIAGGEGLLETVECLRYETTDLRQETELRPESNRLVFLSLNAAGDAHQFQRSANYIAVALAGIYGAHHLCALPEAVEDSRTSYEESVRDIDLLVTSVASTGPPSFFGDWLRANFKGTTPPQMAGDIAFIPVDTDGRRCECPPLVRERIEQVFRPRPTYDELKEIAAEKRVLLILRSLTRDPRRATVARGILERRLANVCVLGADFARTLISG